MKHHISVETRELFIFTFSSSFIIGILTHAFMFFNKLPNHDDLVHLPTKSISSWIVLGRWMSKYVSIISGNYTMPAILGIISVFYLSIASAIIAIWLFRFSTRFECFFSSALLMTFPVLASIFSYIHGADTFTFALLLAVIAIAIYNKGITHIILASILQGLVIAIHPMFLSFSISLFSTLIIISILKKIQIHLILANILKYSITLLLGFVGHLAILKILLKYYGISLQTYQGVNNVNNITFITRILDNFIKYTVESYSGFFKFFFQYPWGNINKFHTLLFYVNTTFFTFTCVLLLIIIIYTHVYKNKILWLLLISVLALFPVAINNIVIFSQGQSAATLYAYPLVLPYILSIKLISILPKNQIKPLISKPLFMIIIMIVWSNCIVVNTAYLQLFYTYQQLYAFTVKLESKIESTDGYYLGIPIILLGRAHEKSLNNIIFDNVDRMVGILTPYDMFIGYSYDKFMKYYTGFQSPLYGYDYIKKVRRLDVVQRMPTYPSKLSLKVIDGLLIVKFGMSEIFSPYNSEYFYPQYVDLNIDEIQDYANITNVLK